MLGFNALSETALSEIPPYLVPSLGAISGLAVVGGDGAATGASLGTITGTATVQGVGATALQSFDYLRTIISQYANSPIILQLIDSFDQCVDQQANMQAFYDNIWNIDSAQGYGLDVWGRIVGVSRTLTVEVGTYFGMTGPTGPSGEPYNSAPFYAGGKLTENFDLTDEAYRTLIFAKALANISDGTIKSINQLLINLFGASGNCYCTDGQDMTMTYTFSFPLTPVQFSIVEQANVLPKPVGVIASIVQL